MPPSRPPVVGIALGAVVAIAALLFPPLFAVREASSLRDLAAGIVAAMLGVTEVTGLRLLDLARALDGGTRDPVFVAWAVAVGAAVLALVTCARPRVARLLAVVGLAGVAAMALVPRVVGDGNVSTLGQLVRVADPAVGFYVALAGFALVVLGGVPRGRG